MTDQPRCLNPLPHPAHDWLADSDAITYSRCPGRPDLSPTAGHGHHSAPVRGCRKCPEVR